MLNMLIITMRRDKIRQNNRIKAHTETISWAYGYMVCMYIVRFTLHRNAF